MLEGDGSSAKVDELLEIFLRPLRCDVGDDSTSLIRFQYKYPGSGG